MYLIKYAKIRIGEEQRANAYYNYYITIKDALIFFLMAYQHSWII